MAAQDKHKRGTFKRWMPNKNFFVHVITYKLLGGYSQNFLRRIHKIFVTLGLKILIFLKLKKFLKRKSSNVD